MQSHQRRRRLEQQHDARAAVDEPDEALDLRRAREEREHEHRCAGVERGVDLLPGVRVQRVEAREERRAPDASAERAEIGQLVIGNAGVGDVALAFVLDEPLDVDADPVDAGGVGAAGQLGIASDDGEGERRHDGSARPPARAAAPQNGFGSVPSPTGRRQSSGSS